MLSFVWRRTNPRFLKAPRNLPSFQLEWLIAPHAFATLVNQRRWDEVLNAVLRGLAEKPGDPILHYWAGVARFHQRDFVQAVLSLRSAEKLGLDTAPFHEALGVTYYAIRQHVLFLQQMRAAIRAVGYEAAIRRIEAGAQRSVGPTRRWRSCSSRPIRTLQCNMHKRP